MSAPAMNIKPLVLCVLGLALSLFPLYFVVAILVYVVTGHAWIPNDDGLCTRGVIAFVMSMLLASGALLSFTAAVKR